MIILNNNTLHTEKYQAQIFGSFAYKVVCVDDRFSKPVVLYRGRNEVYTFIEIILGVWLLQNVIKKHFNKNLFMSEENEQIFQLSNECWTFNKWFDIGDNKAR